jgi:hypothetical protein
LAFAAAAALFMFVVGCSAPADAPPAVPNVVTIRATDYAFEAPTEIPAGMTTFRLVNASPGFHHAVVVRLDSGKTYADLQAAMSQHGPPPAWMTVVGGPNAPDPQMESNSTFDVGEGTYAIICVVDIPEGVPHVARGMMSPLTVTATTAPSAPAPTADVKITLFDYNFTLSKPLAAGPQTIEVVGSPGQPHELEIIALLPGKTQADLMAWMEKMEGPPPGKAIGGTAPAQAGFSQFMTADFAPGDYVLLCFLPDVNDTKPHFAHGMIQVVNIN